MAIIKSNACGALDVSGGTPSTPGNVTVTVNNNESSGCSCGCGSGGGSGTPTTPTPGNPGSPGKPPDNPTPPKGNDPPKSAEPRKPQGGVCIPLGLPVYTDYGQNPGLKFEQFQIQGLITTAATTGKLFDPKTETIVGATIKVEGYCYQELSGAVGLDGVMAPIPGKGVSNLLVNFVGAPTFGADAWGRISGYPIAFTDAYGAWKGINLALPCIKGVCVEVSLSAATFRKYSDTVKVDMQTPGIVTIDGMLPSPANIAGFLFGPHDPPIPDDPAWLQISLCSVSVLKQGQPGGPTGPGTPGTQPPERGNGPKQPASGDKEVKVDCINLQLGHPFNSATFGDVNVNLSAKIITAASSSEAGPDKLKSGETIKSAKFDLMAVSENGTPSGFGWAVDGSTLDNFLRLTGSDNVEIPLPGVSEVRWRRTAYDNAQMVGHTWNEKCNMSLIGSNILLNSKMYQLSVIPHAHTTPDMNDGAWLSACLTSFVKSGTTACPVVLPVTIKQDNESCWLLPMSSPSNQRSGIKKGTLVGTGVCLQVAYAPAWAAGNYGFTLYRADRVVFDNNGFVNAAASNAALANVLEYTCYACGGSSPAGGDAFGNSGLGLSNSDGLTEDSELILTVSTDAGPKLLGLRIENDGGKIYADW
jgi:hypothetical protein